MTPKQEKTAIMKKISDNPNLSIGQIAKMLGLGRSTLIHRIKEYGIEHGRKPGRKTGVGRKTIEI